MSLREKVFWAAFATVFTTLLAMAWWSAPLIQEEARGMGPLDIWGQIHNSTETLWFLYAISEDGRTFYLNVHLYLELAFTVSLGVVFAVASHKIFSSWFAWLLIVPICAAVLCGFAEVVLIYNLLSVVPSRADQQLIPYYQLALITKVVVFTLALLPISIFARWRLFRF